MQLRTGIILVVFVLAAETLRAQAAEDIQLNFYAGAALFPAAHDEALLTGFKPGVMAGAGVSKAFRAGLVYNPNLEFTQTSRDHYSMSLISFHNNLKYYPWWYRKVRPYAMIVGNISFMNLHQHAFQTVIDPDASYSGTDPADVPVNQIINRNADVKMQFAPMVGIGAGIGVDFTSKFHIIPYVQYSFVGYFSKSVGVLNRDFQHNSSSLMVQGFVIGARYRLSYFVAL